MAKKVAKKDEAKKSLKKVKSFNLDDKIYSSLMEILEASGTQITLSALVDEFLRKLYVYLIEADGFIKRQKTDLPVSDVLYDCQRIEYFRESNRKETRLRNLILSHEASKRGLPLSVYLEELGPDAAFLDD